MIVAPALVVMGLITGIVGLLGLRYAVGDRFRRERADGAIGALAIVALIGFAWATKECMGAGTCATPRVLSERAGLELAPARATLIRPIAETTP
jgi:hypothetical protein